MDKKFSGSLIAFFLLFLVFIALVVFNKPISRFTRAKEDFVLSSQKSLIFAWPLTVKADGKSKTQINVIIRSSNNKLIQNKQTTVRSTLGVVKIISSVTDSGGKSSFELSSTVPGIAEITAYADNVLLGKKLTIKFE